jgi:hypothetical protein
MVVKYTASGGGAGLGSGGTRRQLVVGRGNKWELAEMGAKRAMASGRAKLGGGWGNASYYRFHMGRGGKREACGDTSILYHYFVS